jgi:hypothetical protein
MASFSRAKGEQLITTCIAQGQWPCIAQGQWPCIAQGQWPWQARREAPLLPSPELHGSTD